MTMRHVNLPALFACAIGLLATYPQTGASAPARFWLSPSILDPMGPPADFNSVPAEPTVVGSSNQRFMHIWAQPQTTGPGPWEPDMNPFDTFRNISLATVRFDSNLDINQNGLVLHNPITMNGVPRFQFTAGGLTNFPTTPPGGIAESVTFLGFTLNTMAGVGIGSDCDSDPLCTVMPNGQPAWLFGSVPYTVSGSGLDAEAFLQVGGDGINHIGGMTSTTNVTLGSQDGPMVYNAGNTAHRNITFAGDMADLRIPRAANTNQTLMRNAGSGEWDDVNTDWNVAVVPNSLDDAVLPGAGVNDLITVRGSQEANHTMVSGGRLSIAADGALASNVHVTTGAISGPGWLVGNLDLDGTLEIEAETPLRVLGTADVSGATIGFTNDLYLPIGKVDVTILEASGGRSGLFTTAVNDVIFTGPGGTDVRVTQITHMDNSVVVELTSTLPPSHFGDYDGDGKVDAADYTLWRNVTLGEMIVGDADGNGDDVINEADYGVWRDHFGAVRLTPKAGVQAVPEPGAILMLVLAAIGGAACRTMRA